MEGYSNDSGSSLVAILNVSWRARPLPIIIRARSRYYSLSPRVDCSGHWPTAPRSNDTVQPSIIPPATHVGTVPDQQRQPRPARSSEMPVTVATMIYRISIAYNFTTMMCLRPQSGMPGDLYVFRNTPKNFSEETVLNYFVKCVYYTVLFSRCKYMCDKIISTICHYWHIVHSKTAKISSSLSSLYSFIEKLSDTTLTW